MQKHEIARGADRRRRTRAMAAAATAAAQLDMTTLPMCLERLNDKATQRTAAEELAGIVRVRFAVKAS